MESQSHEKIINADAIPTIEILDPYEYISSNKIIANLIIKGKQGKKNRTLTRTKYGGYMMQ